MDFKIRFSEDALNDLEEIFAYSWANFPESTEHFGRAILAHIDSLAQFPRMGKPVHDGSGMRVLTHTPFRVTYEIWEEDGTIQILEIRHASRR